jgi:hypothetical protein
MPRRPTREIPRVKKWSEVIPLPLHRSRVDVGVRTQVPGELVACPRESSLWPSNEEPSVAAVKSVLSRLQRLVNPKLIIVLLVLAAALCLGTLTYVQHENRSIVDRDMQTAVTLSEIAARFDHEDGNLYRLMVDEAASGHPSSMTRRVDFDGSQGGGASAVRSGSFARNLRRRRDRQI